MTRDEIRGEILKITSPHILCELPTSMGKTRIAIERIVQKNVQPQKLLVVIPRLVLIDTWKDEFDKWGHPEYKECKFVTYVSFPKLGGKWDFVIFDECHHLSMRCMEALPAYRFEYSMMLSATVKLEMKYLFRTLFKETITFYKYNVRQATDEGILPDPKVYLIPIHLKNSPSTYEIIHNPKMGNPMVCFYKDRFTARKIKNRRIVIRCSQREYYADMSGLIEFYKRKSFNNPVLKNTFLRKSGERLKWLSDEKTEFVKQILAKISSERTLTFCNGIAQTEELGTYCINSKNKESDDNLEAFNNGTIDHITACNMLDEGVNLVNCRIGVYATLNASDRMIVQKLGRLLRHPDPIIIIPYYRFTRDEEIVEKMCKNYNKDLVTVIKNLDDLKL